MAQPQITIHQHFPVVDVGPARRAAKRLAREADNLVRELAILAEGVQAMEETWDGHVGKLREYGIVTKGEEQDD